MEMDRTGSGACTAALVADRDRTFVSALAQGAESADAPRPGLARAGSAAGASAGGRGAGTALLHAAIRYRAQLPGTTVSLAGTAANDARIPGGDALVAAAAGTAAGAPQVFSRALRHGQVRQASPEPGGMPGDGGDGATSGRVHSSARAARAVSGAAPG